MSTTVDVRRWLQSGGRGDGGQADCAALEVRDRRADDLKELVGLAARVREVDRYPIFLPTGDFERFLTTPKPLAAWVAIHDERLIGHVALNAKTSRPVMQLVADLTREQPAIYIARLLVDPGARRKGVGRTLLERARRTAIDSGHLPILDVVDTPAAAAALALYRRDGWQEVGRVSFDLGDAEVDELVFRGPLS